MTSPIADLISIVALAGSALHRFQFVMESKIVQAVTTKSIVVSETFLYYEKICENLMGALLIESLL